MTSVLDCGLRIADCGWKEKPRDGAFRSFQSAIRNRQAAIGENARVTTADAEQTAVAAFLPWRGS